MRYAICLLAATLAACGGGYASHVDAGETALGRVVVYRNGIAYYERRAKVVDDKLVLNVPLDKVDDFLKSLTVAEADTGDSVPVSYPTAGASSGSNVEMTIQVPEGTGTDLIITYITDAPAWKPSYRVVVDEKGEVAVQGWAIVDNTSGEDWTQVTVGVGSSSALSFRYDLRSVVRVHREQLGGGRAFVQAPPTGGATRTEGAESEAVVLALGDDQIMRPMGHPDAEPSPAMDASADYGDVYEDEKEMSVGGAVTPSRKARAKPEAVKRADAARRSAAARAHDARLQALAGKLRGNRDRVTVEGYAKAGESGARSLDRANVVRNRLIELGVAPTRVVVDGRGYTEGKNAGVELKLSKAPADAAEQDDGRPVGESHFESKVPMTITRGTSAMVSVLESKTPGEVVYLYDPDSQRGDARYAFRAVRFRNPTDSTLEAGPVTVYGESRFIGEGLTESIPPEATSVIPFALDRQVLVERKHDNRDEVARLISVHRGVFTAEVRHTRRTKFRVVNRQHKATTVFLRHGLPNGWQLGEAPDAYERRGESYLFAVELGAEQTKEVVVEAWTPLTRTVDLRSTIGIDLMRRYLETKPGDAQFATAVRDLLGVHDEMAEHRTRIDSLRARMGEFRGRTEELTEQIERLDITRTGRTLRRHLEKKLAEISERVQTSTMEVVEQQEKLMLARIRFQDAVAELTLETPTKVAERG